MSAAASCSEKTIEAVHPADIVDTTAFELDTAGHCSTPETDSDSDSAMTRLLRTVHTSARAGAIPKQWLAQGVRDFTKTGKPVPLRPPRATRVNLPSGYPEPPTYPQPAAYWAELDAIDAKGKPKPHPLWAFFRVPAELKARPEAHTMPDNFGTIELLDDEDEGLKSGEYTFLAAGRAGRLEVVWGRKWRQGERERESWDRRKSAPGENVRGDGRQQTATAAWNAGPRPKGNSSGWTCGRQQRSAA